MGRRTRAATAVVVNTEHGAVQDGTASQFFEVKVGTRVFIIILYRTYERSLWCVMEDPSSFECGQ